MKTILVIIILLFSRTNHSKSQDCLYGSDGENNRYANIGNANTSLKSANFDPLSFILKVVFENFLNNKRPEVDVQTFAGIAPSDQKVEEEDFQPLFDGETLNGWNGDPRLWSVEDGAIVGSTDSTSIPHNSFLIYTAKQFGDFVFRAQVKLHNHNSGIQFRSEALPEWVCKGYQADMAEGNWWGSLYDEGGKRGVMVNGWKDKAETVVKPSEWNEIEIYCKGENIRITLNGMVTAELKDSERLKGFLALQLHMGPPMEVRFRNIRIKPL